MNSLPGAVLSNDLVDVFKVRNSSGNGNSDDTVTGPSEPMEGRSEFSNNVNSNTPRGTVTGNSLTNTPSPRNAN